MEKTLDTSAENPARKAIPDLKVVGKTDRFQLLFKASSKAEGWMKSTKAMDVQVGCVVQVTTQQIDEDGSYSVAEALAFVPGVRVADDENGGRKLVAI